jgi:hypothetical protein
MFSPGEIRAELFNKLYNDASTCNEKFNSFDVGIFNMANKNSTIMGQLNQLRKAIISADGSKIAYHIYTRAYESSNVANHHATYNENINILISDIQNLKKAQRLIYGYIDQYIGEEPTTQI